MQQHEIDPAITRASESQFQQQQYPQSTLRCTPAAGTGPECKRNRRKTLCSKRQKINQVYRIAFLSASGFFCCPGSPSDSCRPIRSHVVSPVSQGCASPRPPATYNYHYCTLNTTTHAQICASCRETRKSRNKSESRKKKLRSSGHMIFREVEKWKNCFCVCGWWRCGPVAGGV